MSTFLLIYLYDRKPEDPTEETRRKNIISKSIKPYKNKIPDGETCAICLSDLKSAKPVVLEKPALQQNELAKTEDSVDIEINGETPFQTDKCNHFFHKECLETWLMIKMRCPTCRTPIDPKLIKKDSSTQTESQSSQVNAEPAGDNMTN